MEQFEYPGSQSIRSQVGIAQDDPAIFRPFAVAECVEAAAMLSADRSIPTTVRRLALVGLCLDLRPGHLTSTKSRLSRQLRRDRKTIVAHELSWEAVDPALRADIVGRAVRMILVRRAQRRA